MQAKIKVTTLKRIDVEIEVIVKPEWVKMHEDKMVAEIINAAYGANLPEGIADLLNDHETITTQALSFNGITRRIGEPYKATVWGQFEVILED